jgi:hypothetical protein
MSKSEFKRLNTRALPGHPAGRDGILWGLGISSLHISVPIVHPAS